MKVQDQKLELIDRLIANVRVTLKHAEPDTVEFSGGVLRYLQGERDKLTAQPELTPFPPSNANGSASAKKLRRDDEVAA